MFRSVGSVVFGVWADRYGRKWPYCFNLLLFVVLELATGFCKTYKQFLAIRSLYGIAMGFLAYSNSLVITTNIFSEVFMVMQQRQP